MEHNEKKNEESIVSGWAWYPMVLLLLPLGLFSYLIIDMIPAKESGYYFWIGMCVLYILFCLWGILFLFYRFRIDSEGVTLQRLIRRRFFPWSEIKEVVISARSMPSRWILTAEFCKEVHRPFVKLDVGGFYWPKWCMCVDLNSKQYPSSRLFACVDQELLLKILEDHEIKVWYAPIALKAMHGNAKRGPWE